MLRSFIAVEVSREIQDAIAESISILRKTLPKPLVHWVTPGNVHLTLKFLGDVAPSRLEQLAQFLKKGIGSLGPFPMPIGMFGAFPDSRRARVLWIGIQAPPALVTLQKEVDAIAAQLGYAPEERPFSPHLTIGRVGQGLSASDRLRIRTALEAVKVGALGVVQVDAVHIFKSDLRPGGSVYTNLYTLPLGSK